MSQSCCQLSSLKKKFIVAVTGLLLLGFVLGHLAGNLLIFAGQNPLNDYAEHLRSLGPLLWVIRLGLFTVFITHIVMTIKLVKENREARPVAYAVKKNSRTTPAARTMALSGLLILAFVIYHLLHFTFRTTNPAISHLTDALGRRDVFSMVVLSFRRPPIALTYIAAMLLLGMHLAHGISSVFQTLGIANEKCWPKIVCLSRLLAMVIVLGFISIPISIWCGLIKPVAGVLG